MIHNITGKDSGFYKAVFIDLDGTITESGEGCMNAVRYMFEKAGYEENDEACIHAFVGPPIKMHLINAYGFPKKKRQGYTPTTANTTSPRACMKAGFMTASRTLCAIKSSGKALYVATSKPEIMAIPILSGMGCWAYLTRCSRAP